MAQVLPGKQHDALGGVALAYSFDSGSDTFDRRLRFRDCVRRLMRAERK